MKYPNRKLTAEQVRYIRKELRWQLSVKQLAERFNISQKVIYRILEGSAYKEIK